MGSNLKDRGFSLIELMIVVAIIGILSTFAIPNFQKYKARARQAEAKSLLGAFYTAQKSFHSEHGAYHQRIYITGFGREGYSYDTGTNTFKPGAGTKSYYALHVGGGVTPLSTYGITDPYPGYSIFNGYTATPSLCAEYSYPLELFILSGLGNSTLSESAYDFRVYGCPLIKNTNVLADPYDVWSITDQKVVRNVRSQN